jgi:hypothetical protein
VQKIIILFFALDTLIQGGLNTGYKGISGPLCDLITHQDTQLFEFLPLPIQRHQRPDFKISGHHIH